jgi:hypothetical protein
MTQLISQCIDPVIVALGDAGMNSRGQQQWRADAES